MSVATRKAAERTRYRLAGLVAVTVYIWPECRALLHRFVQRINQRMGAKP